MNQTRIILLTSFLLVAIAAQRFVVTPLSPTSRLTPPPDQNITQLARLLARRIARRETKPRQTPYRFSLRVAGPRLRLLVARLLSATFTPPPLTPFHFRLPPPQCC